MATGDFFVAGALNPIGNLRRDVLCRIGEEQTTGLQPSLAGVNFANITDLARVERDSVECRLNFRVRVVAVDVNEDSPDAPLLPFLNVIQKIDLAGLF